jgi:sterol 3beta-glucosyltransferase
LRGRPNLARHDAVERYHHERLLPPVNRIRRDMLGLAELTEDDAFAHREECPAVLGYSPSVFPPPPDWPIARDVTGYWRLPDAEEPVSAMLVDFVAGGPPPLYVGFGSMNYDLPHFAPLLVELSRRAGVRIVFATGWANREATRSTDWPPGIFVTESVPHAWLFPRVAAVMHHGGAGTTAAAILAGTPSLVAWSIVDQVFWAGRIDQLGVGLDLGCFHDLDVERMIDAVGRLQTDRACSARAAELRLKVAEEDGVGRAVRAIERHVRFTLSGSSYVPSTSRVAEGA